MPWLLKGTSSGLPVFQLHLCCGETSGTGMSV